MKISFADKNLKDLSNDDRRMLKVFGKVRAEIFLRRLVQLRFASTLEDVRRLPGNYHELKNDRKGQWSCDLDQPYRLIFVPLENPIPTNAHGQYSWIEITGVMLIEIVNYHKEK